MTCGGSYNSPPHAQIKALCENICDTDAQCVAYSWEENQLEKCLIYYECDNFTPSAYTTYNKTGRYCSKSNIYFGTKTVKGDI